MNAQLTRDQALTQITTAPYQQLKDSRVERVALSVYQSAYRQFVAAHGVVADDYLTGVVDNDPDLDGWVVCAMTETPEGPDPYLATGIFVGKFAAVYETRQQADDARVAMLAAGISSELLVPSPYESKSVGYLPPTALAVLRNCSAIPAMPAA